MASVQQLLFPDPRPLVERLGREFFRELPECAGVYLMRDAGNAVLYVGKAANLRKRLGSYRVANPDRMARRHLRLLRSVARIELEPCANEAVALAREAELLRALKPKFNRAGTWPGKARFLVWRCVGEEKMEDGGLRVEANHRPDASNESAQMNIPTPHPVPLPVEGRGSDLARFGNSIRERKCGILVLAVVENPAEGWQRFGPLGGGTIYLRAVLARLVWLVANPALTIASMPAGWMQHQFEDETAIECCERLAVVSELIEELLVRQTGGFCAGLRRSLRAELHPFEKALIEEDLEHIASMFEAEGQANDNIVIARPHPIPLPQGEGEHSRDSGVQSANLSGEISPR